MEKYLKLTVLTLGSLVLAELAASLANLIRGAIDLTIINQIDKNSTANDTALRLFSFLRLIHYDQALVVIFIMLSTMISSLIFHRVVQGKLMRTFVVLTVLWLLVVYLLPLVTGQTGIIK